MHPTDVPKTTIITPFGLFEFLRLPFGLRNAAQIFQRMMDRIFGDLPFCFVYLDDILVFSSSLADHQLLLRHVLNLCHLNGLTINLEKYVIAASQVEYLGHSVSSSGSAPLHKHYFSATHRLPSFAAVPEDGELLQKVYTWNCSGPLTDALRGDPKDCSWSPQMDYAFVSAKSALALVPTLVH